MFFVRIFRFLMGSFYFCCSLGFYDSFVNLCKNENIKVTDIRKTQNAIFGYAPLKSYEKLKDCAEKSGMNLSIIKEYGLIPFVKRNKNRVGILIGSVISVILIILLSSTIWSIDVKGNKKFTKEQIVKICEDNGIKKGVFAHSIKIKEIQNTVIDEYEDIIWFSVNIIGSKAYIEMMENIKKPEMFTESLPCNVISSLDGEIISIEVDRGTCVIADGGAVYKGQLLISGVMNNLDGTNRYVHARGRVKVRFNRIVYSTVSQNDKIYSIKEIKKRKSLYLFGLKIPLGISYEKCGKFKYSSFIQSDNVTLPVGFVCENYTFLQPDNSKLDTNRLLLLTGYEFFKKEQNSNKNCEIESKNMSYTVENGICTVQGKYILLQNSAVEQYFSASNVE